MFQTSGSSKASHVALSSFVRVCALGQRDTVTLHTHVNPYSHHTACVRVWLCTYTQYVCVKVVEVDIWIAWHVVNMLDYYKHHFLVIVVTCQNTMSHRQWKRKQRQKNSSYSQGSRLFHERNTSVKLETVGLFNLLLAILWCCGIVNYFLLLTITW